MGVRVAVDAMGGDHAPRVIVRGALHALSEDRELELVLLGDEKQIQTELEHGVTAELRKRLTVHHTSQVIDMHESPVDALRHKRDSSLVKMVEMGASRQVDAILSAGNTGAVAAACQLMMKPLPNVSRPGIAVPIPSFYGPFVLCEVGANIQAKPRHLLEYGVMASLYAERVLGVVNPRVGIISIGEESGKGTELVRQAYELLKDCEAIQFIGNVEGRELFENRCDVAVCDGFTGNVALKLLEGISEGMFRTIVREFDDDAPELRMRVGDVIKRVWERHDYSRYGGAPLLGIDGICIICHGRSTEVAIQNAIGVARRFVANGLNETISARLR